MSVAISDALAMGLEDVGGPPQGSGPLIRGRHPLGMVALTRYESMGAGHTLARHVHDAHGQYKNDAERLAADPHIPASGGFTDRATAQRSVDVAVTSRAAQILRWRPGADRFTPFITEVALDRVNGHNLSRELYDRGVRESQPTSGVRCVLMPDSRFSAGFAVLTAYNVTVPARPRRVYAAPPLPAATGSAETQFAAGARTATRFVSTAAARGTVAAGIRYWSAEIEEWLDEPSGPATLARAYCAPRTVGQTLTRDEWSRGEVRWTTTPVAIIVLGRDAAAADGFVVISATPARSF